MSADEERRKEQKPVLEADAALKLAAELFGFAPFGDSPVKPLVR